MNFQSLSGKHKNRPGMEHPPNAQNGPYHLNHFCTFQILAFATFFSSTFRRNFVTRFGAATREFKFNMLSREAGGFGAQRVFALGGETHEKCRHSTYGSSFCGLAASLPLSFFDSWADSEEPAFSKTLKRSSIFQLHEYTPSD